MRHFRPQGSAARYKRAPYASLTRLRKQPFLNFSLLASQPAADCMHHTSPYNAQTHSCRQ
ncbi:MAG: hypothetical protein NZM35_10005 [Chitinophagales bacterium]|nr:hypothetical protein [Chitinophagales bacterium]MDW8419644.1 hypothetical protein [Chitinophagales bacterium]